MEKPSDLRRTKYLCESFLSIMAKSVKKKREMSKLKKKFIEYYSKLPIQKLAADRIGKDEDTITNWKKKDKKFSDELGIAKSEWALENAIQVKKKEWLLERVLGEHFGESIKVEHGTSEKLEKTLDRISSLFP